MSKTEMLSVPRELLERCDFGKNTATALAALPELRAILAKPADQHQGEPVALPACKAKLSMSHDWDQGYADGWNACLDEIAKLGSLYPRPVQGDPVSRWTNKTGDQFRLCPVVGNLEVLIREYGNPDKWVAVNMTPAHALTHLSPLYTHADPAEVERLRDQLAAWQALAAERLEVATGLRAQAAQHKLAMDAASAQLAERDALLRNLRPAISMVLNALDRDAAEGKAARGEMAAELRAALSASAEPSAPPEQSEWRPLTAPGQIKEGDRLSFRVGSSFICARARQIIAPGTDKEEVVYNRKKNHYFLTSMAVDGTSSHKNVMVARVTA